MKFSQQFTQPQQPKNQRHQNNPHGKGKKKGQGGQHFSTGPNESICNILKMSLSF